MRISSLILPIVLAACAATSPPRAGVAEAASAPSSNALDTRTLERYHWVLDAATDRSGARIDALFAPPRKPLQLDFNDGRIAVVNACNAIGGGYELRDGRLRVAHLMSTLMACVDPKVGALDAAIRHRLERAPTIALLGDGSAPRLELRGDDGDRLVFAGQPTAETRYGGPGERVFLEVAAQTVPCDAARAHDARCLRVRELHYDANGLRAGEPGPWQVLTQPIEGYAHEDGVRNVLRLKRFHAANATAGAPVMAYVLDMVVESEVVKP